MQPLWLLASTAVAGLAGSLLVDWHGIWAEAGPGTSVTAAGALFAASAGLAWFTPRYEPARELLSRPALLAAVERHLRTGEAGALLMCDLPPGDSREEMWTELRQRLPLLLQKDGLAARWSEDRLVIFLPGQSDALAVLALARLLIGNPAPPDAAAGICQHAGIALAPSDGTSPRDLLEGAELALAEARQQGTPAYGFYTPRLSASAQRDVALQRAVNDAISRDSLRLDFQPVFNMRSGELSGFEALVRLHDPELGPVRPSEFIPLAERDGRIVEIGQWALEEACRVAAQWPSHLVVAVNLSPAELLSGTLVNNVRRALQRHQLPAYRLEVEITEGTLMTDSELVLSQLRTLRDMGVGVALDDFGTGFSSLSYLCRFPFSKLKIDRSFASALDHSASAKNVLRAIVRLGHGLGMTVTAEGIETERQLALLRGIGCDLAQGYLLGRPAPLADLAEIILRNFAEGLGRRPKSGSRSAA